MNDSAEIAIASPQLQANKPKIKYAILFKQFYQLVAPYWRSEQKIAAWIMLITVFGLNMAMIYVAVLINDWNGEFYDTLQKLDKANFTKLLFQFFWLVMTLIVIAVSEAFLKAYLGFRWRIWMTKQIMSEWLHDSTFYRLFTHKTKTENPDQRISQDLNLFTAATLSLGFSIITQFIKSITFAFILWKLSSNMLLPLPGGSQLNIPGYMLWMTIIYVAFCTFVIYKTGKPLIALDYAQEKVEADFRFNLMRIRERRDEVAMLNGSPAETQFLNNNLLAVIKNYKQIIRRNIYVNTFQYLFLNLTTILPVLLAAPMFFSGAITLGILMQIANAFGQVEGALMIFAVNFQSFASWKATFNRIIDFKTEMLELTQNAAVSDFSTNASSDSAFNISAVAGPAALQIKNVSLNLPERNNTTQFNFDVKPQEKVLLMGPSGLGKSTLIKCIAGHWPFASGSIQRPTDLKIIPQKPYFPISTLRASLLYPDLDVDITNAELKHVLIECHLEHLQGSLDVVHDWNSMLSLGEQQRLNFARVLLAKPQWLIMDEPTAAMDKDLEAKLFAVLFKELPNITLLTIGHAITLRDFHTRCIELC